MISPQNGTPPLPMASSYDRLGTIFAPDDSDANSDEDDMPRVRRRVGPIRRLLHESKLASFYEEHCAYLPPMAGWFVSSMGLSTYNKYVFGEKHMDFPCPLLLTSMHFTCQWGFSLGMCKMFPITFGSKRVDDMTWSEFLSISIPCGLVTSGDVGLSNLALVTISITFYTMVKAATPIFVLIWAYFFGIMRITWTLIGVMFVIACGEFLTVLGEVDFKMNGFLLCLMASITSGARWTLVQLKIQTVEPPLKTTVATMRILSPFMALSMIAVACALERPWNSLRGVVTSWPTFFDVILLGLGGAFMAIFMIMCEFYLIMHTNAVVLMIGGVIKEILTIFMGVMVFGDKLNLVNTLGVCVVFTGVILYKVMLQLEKQEKKARDAISIAKVASGDAQDTPPNEKERQPLRLTQDDSISESDDGMNEYNDQVERDEGIEMRQNKPLRSRSSDLVRTTLSHSSHGPAGDTTSMTIV